MLKRFELLNGFASDAAMRLDCHIGDNIRQARARQGTSLAELGHAVGLQEVSVARYEAGLERVAPTMLYKIAVKLDVTLASLFGVARF